MTKEEITILVKGYWVKILEVLNDSRNKYKINSAKEVKEIFQKINVYLDRIIELEKENEK